MPLVFRCSQCGKTHTRDEKWAGKVINCEGCAKGMRIPSAQLSAVAAGPRPDAARSLEPQPVAGPSGSFPRMRPVPDEAAGKPAGKEGEKKRSLLASVTSGVVAFLLVAGVVGRYAIRPYLAYQKAQQNQQQAQNLAPPPGVDIPLAPPAATTNPPASPASPAWRMPELPQLDVGTLIEPGVWLYEVHLPGNKPGQPAMPGHSGKLWLYLPEGQHDPQSLPCVLIAGAGSNLVTGMELTDGDRPEHLPYARAGMAVLAYELDGMVKEKSPNDAAFGATSARSSTPRPAWSTCGSPSSSRPPGCRRSTPNGSMPPDTARRGRSPCSSPRTSPGSRPAPHSPP